MSCTSYKAIKLFQNFVIRNLLHVLTKLFYNTFILIENLIRTTMFLLYTLIILLFDIGECFKDRMYRHIASLKNCLLKDRAIICHDYLVLQSA